MINLPKYILIDFNPLTQRFRSGHQIYNGSTRAYKEMNGPQWTACLAKGYIQIKKNNFYYDYYFNILRRNIDEQKIKL